MGFKWGLGYNFLIRPQKGLSKHQNNIKKGFMMLTETEIRKLPIRIKKYKVSDRDGLYLIVRPTGSKSFIYRYTLKDKRTQVSKTGECTIGLYPDVSLEEAREVLPRLRKQVKKGIKPNINYRDDENLLFSELSERYFKEISSKIEESTFKDYVSLVNNHINPIIGDMEVKSITEKDTARVIDVMTKKNIKTMQKDARALMQRIFKHAPLIMEYTRRNPADIDIKLLIPKHEEKPFRHILDESKISEMLKKIKSRKASKSVTVALELLPYVFLRPINVVSAKWEHIDFENRIWVIPKEEMKMRRDHSIPLTDTIINILKKMEFCKEYSQWVFPSPLDNKKHIARDNLRVTLNRMNIDSTAHGMRHMASTILRENGAKEGFSKDAIEFQLAHVEGGISGIYNHAEYLEERFKIMNWWCDYLDKLSE